MSQHHDVFIFGLANSLHCAGMCGPLASCVAQSKTGVAAYHLARVSAYAGLGAIAASVGQVVDGAFADGRPELPSAWFSIIMAVVLLIGVTGLVRLPSAGRGTALLTRGLRWAHGLSGMNRGFMVGALTPLLPCGVLYLAVAMALVAKGPLAGASTLAVFALGSLPGVALVQLNAQWLQHNLSAGGRRRLFRLMMLVAAAVLLYRGIADLSGSSCCAG